MVDHQDAISVAILVAAGIVVFAIALAFYLIPAIIAYKRHHPHRLAILIVDILFGATVIGWVGTLIWALITPQTAEFSIPIRQVGQPIGRQTQQQVRREPTISDTKICPSCAEEVRYAARRCRFCGHEFAITA